MSNKYIFHSRISEHDFRRIIRCFSVDIEASKMAVLTGLSRNIINRIISAVRQRVAECGELESPLNAVNSNWMKAVSVPGVYEEFAVVAQKEKPLCLD